MGKKLKYKADGKDKENIGCGTEFNQNKKNIKEYLSWSEDRFENFNNSSKTFEECLVSKKNKTEDWMLGREKKKSKRSRPNNSGIWKI